MTHRLPPSANLGSDPHPTPPARPARKRWLALGVLLTLAAIPAAWAFGPHVKGQLPPAELGPHGALAMKAQEV